MSEHREQSEEVAAFLAAGGKIQEIPRGKSGYQEGQTRSAWGAPRKAAVASSEAAAPAAKKAAKKVVKKK